jgi:hypothetical protein
MSEGDYTGGPKSTEVVSVSLRQKQPQLILDILCSLPQTLTTSADFGHPV